MLRASLVAGLSLLFLLPTARPQDTLLEFAGSGPLDGFGWSLSGGRDVDGDGVPDLLVGAPQDALVYDSSTGRVVVYSGATGAELFGLNGVGSLDQFGEAVAGVGDVDGDGVPDLLVGAGSADPDGVTSAGQARVFSGVDGALIHDLAGPSSGAFLGRAAAGVGDVDFDGTPDFLVGGQGLALLYSGATAAVLRSFEHADPSFGFSVAGAGDLDGNGTPDLLIGAPGAGNGGEVYAFDGHTGAILHRVAGGVSGAALQGWSVSALGDVDGDGGADYLVGAPKHIAFGGQQGRVKVISGADGSVLLGVNGADVGAGLFGEFGDQLDALPDANGDGLPDLLVTAPGSAHVLVLASSDGAVIEDLQGSVNDGFGAAAVTLGDANADGTADLLVGAAHFAREAILFSGATSEQLYTVEGEGQGFGEDLAVLGDVDGDGVNDFVVGARLGQAQGPGLPGRALLRSGLDGAALLTLVGDSADDRFGFAVALLDDVTGDGAADLLVGAPQADPGGLAEAGVARVFSGADGSLVHTLEGAAAGARLGAAAARLPDLDDDGLADFAVGAPGSGTVLVVSGANAGTLHTLSSAAASFGAVVTVAGDQNGDGRREILVGAPTATSDFLFGFKGRVELFDGADGDLLFAWDGASATGEELGTGLAGGLDWNADGKPDVFAGAPLFDGAGLTDNGRVRVFSGLDGSVLDTLSGATDRGRFGSAVAVIDDADGDGVAELAVGAPGSDLSAAANPGEVFVFSGATHALLASFTGPDFYDRFGSSLAAAGDLDGDGTGDLLVGLPGLGDGAFAQVGGARVVTAVDFPEGVTSFGAGCAGSAGMVPVAVSGGGAPSVGNAGFTLGVTDATPSAPGFFIVGLSRTDWDGVPLPFSLAGAGLPGCTLFVAGDRFLNIVTTPAGERTVASPVPNDPALVGGKVFVQWYVSDPAPGFKPGAVSQALQLEIQP